MKPVIALVGRPNVGKSTLFNRLTRTRDALVADYPGLTRDRKYGDGRLGDYLYTVVDTGGIGLIPGEKSTDIIATATVEQVNLAIESAESPDWPKGLDDAAAERAFRVAMYELNGFPPWMPRLFAHAPAVVTRLALAEIDFELARTGDGGSTRFLI